MADNENIHELKKELADIVGQLLEQEKLLDENFSDELRGHVQLLKARLNYRFWSLLFVRLEHALIDSGNGTLVFGHEDIKLFNFGFLDERLFPGGIVDCETDFTDSQFNVIHMTEWLAMVDANYMEMRKKESIEDFISDIDDNIEKLNTKLADIEDRRRTEIITLFKDEEPLAGLLRAFEDANVVSFLSDQIKRSRSLGRAETTRFVKSQLIIPKIQTHINAILQDEALRTHFHGISDEIIRLRKAIKHLEIEREKQINDLYATEDRQKELLQERKVKLEERLLEVKEDIELCSRWGKSESYSVLFKNRPLNVKKDVLQTIRLIEDYDPGLFNNRRVELKGKPLILITPGVGNGSYDYRTNTLIIPITSPVSLMESVAYGLALYRRDIDKEIYDERLWNSFFDHNVWKHIKDRGMPNTFRHQMMEFVSNYVKWTTKEARGSMVLDAPIREWFEDNIGPDKRGLMIPRHLRSMKMLEMDDMIRKYSADENDPLNCYHLIIIFNRKGDYNKALYYAERALELQPDMAEVKWAKAMILMDTTSDITQLKLMTPVQRLLAAREELSDFIKMVRSWWTLKALEHIRKIDENIGKRG
ncbi:MAG: tetratricopeptide repeat protein [Planctomycetes bacterium]|nr:tetratricopeptide repeat protein [Planctomycetota bacterium]